MTPSHSLLSCFTMLRRCTNVSGVSEGLLATRMCSGCEVARYCSPACQKQHWRAHKGACRAHQQLQQSGTGHESTEG